MGLTVPAGLSLTFSWPRTLWPGQIGEVPNAQGWGCSGASRLPCSWLGWWDGLWLPGPALTGLAWTPNTPEGDPSWGGEEQTAIARSLAPTTRVSLLPLWRRTFNPTLAAEEPHKAGVPLGNCSETWLAVGTSVSLSFVQAELQPPRYDDKAIMAYKTSC